VNARVLLSHPGCGPFVQNAARALYEKDLLASYVTTFSYWPDRWSGKALRNSFRLAYCNPEKELCRRLITEVPQELVINHPVPEFLRMGTSKLGFGEIAANFVWERTEKWFDRIVARRHLDRIDAVYGYEHACLETFRAMKERGALCIYDQPIAHHATLSSILDAEFSKFPELRTARDSHIAERRHRYAARKEAELALSDRVVVGSNFVRDSLVQAGVARERVWVIPSGAPPVETRFRRSGSTRFIILAAGHMSVRKGTHYLLQAWRKLSLPEWVELWMVGKWFLPESWRQGLPGNVRIRDTVPRPELYSLFDQASVLVFPTLAEGLALTPLQAMARALPVITTPNSGSDGFIEDGINGRLIRSADVESLVNVLSWAIQHSSQLRDMGFRAAERMAKWQWSHYRSQFGAQVSELLSESMEPHRSYGST
jgi:glycosyltransferase involved in cell wall biosynthesis